VVFKQAHQPIESRDIVINGGNIVCANIDGGNIVCKRAVGIRRSKIFINI